jgi:hypothetical protein
MQCPVVLLVVVNLREGKALGSEKVKFEDVNFVLSIGKKFSWCFNAFDRK